MGKNIGGVYQIRNLSNGKKYIGQTTNFIKRKSAHFVSLKNRCHYNTYLQNSYNKHKKKSFKFEILLYCEPFELTRYEQFFVDRENKNNLYNVCLECVDSPLGVEVSKETRKRMSKSKTGIERPDQSERMSGNRNPMWGRHHSKETRSAISDANKGKSHPQSEETKQKIKDAITGIKRSKQTRKKMSICAKERFSVLENNPMYGKTHSKEARKKMSKTALKKYANGRVHPMQGNKHSEESKIKMSVSAKRRHNNRPLIFDCFLFFQELDLLEIRLNELENVVDYFILHESTKTHSGKDKELFFLKNKDRFKKFDKKIIHKVIDDTPSRYTNLTEKRDKDELYNNVINKINSHTHWNKQVESYGRDSFEKESLIRSLSSCLPSDIVLLSDLDEIPSSITLKRIIDSFDKNKIYHLQQNVYYYYLNLRKNEPWYGTILLSYENFKNSSFCTMRQNKQGIFVDNGGWHFSYQGGTDAIKNKIEAFGEQSLNLDWVKSGLENKIENAIISGRDLYNRPCKFWVEPISYKTHPQYLVDHQDDIFEKYIYKNS